MQEGTQVGKAIVDSSSFWMSVIESAMDAIITIDERQNITIFNRAAEEIFGYSREEIIGKAIGLLLPERYRQRHAKQIRRFGDVGVTSRSMGHLGTLYGLRAGGEEFPIEASISKIQIKDQRCYTVILRDVTERVRAETALQNKTDELKTMTRQLWQTAKLATMGELAASVAHELNNPLAILSLRIESLKLSLAGSDVQQHELDVMQSEIERMAGLVTNLLQFSRPGERQLSTLDLREEIDKTLELVNNYLANRRINVYRDFAEPLPMVIVDRQQMRQVFLNLFTNAADAMPAGGDLSIQLAAFQGGDQVMVQVSDTGEGIAPEHLNQVTEPFFSTKTAVKGAGLGLAICRRIIEEHGGTMQISSAGKDAGAAVRIVLPVVNVENSLIS